MRTRPTSRVGRHPSFATSARNYSILKRHCGCTLLRNTRGRYHFIVPKEREEVKQPRTPLCTLALSANRKCSFPKRPSLSIWNQSTVRHLPPEALRLHQPRFRRPHICVSAAAWIFRSRPSSCTTCAPLLAASYSSRPTRRPTVPRLRAPLLK